MHQIKNIRRTIAALLLVIFSLAVTPKLTVHNWFADHTDQKAKSCNNKSLQLSKAGFNCQCDDQVAESNFISGSSPALFIPACLHLFFNQPAPSFVSVSSLFVDLRGPPNKILIS